MNKTVEARMDRIQGFHGNAESIFKMTAKSVESSLLCNSAIQTIKYIVA